MVLFLMVSSHQVTILPPPKKVTILKRAEIMLVLCLKRLPASFLVLVPLCLFATTLRDIAVVCCCCFNVLFLFCEFR